MEQRRFGNSGLSMMSGPERSVALAPEPSGPGICGASAIVAGAASSGAMRVRARVNQADVNELQVGQPVRVGLDAYPTLFFDGRVAQISPLGVTSVLSAKVRNFIVLVDVNGAHPNLMPDLSASLDVTLARTAAAIVVPRDAIQKNGDRTIVRVQRGKSFEDRAVTVAALNAHDEAIPVRERHLELQINGLMRRDVDHKLT